MALTTGGIAAKVRQVLAPDFTALSTKIDGLVTTVAAQVRTTVEGMVDSLAETLKDKLIEVIMPGSFVTGLKQFLTEILGQAPSTPQLAPINANEVVAQLAAAVHDAEKTLNDQGLVISQGTVEIDVYLKAGSAPPGQAGGKARIVLTVNPRV